MILPPSLYLLIKSCIPEIIYISDICQHFLYLLLVTIIIIMLRKLVYLINNPIQKVMSIVQIVRMVLCICMVDYKRFQRPLLNLYTSWMRLINMVMYKGKI